MAIQDLSSTIRYEFETKGFLARVHTSVSTITRAKGGLAGAAAISAMTVSSVAGAILVWLCMEGSVRSIIDVVEDPRWIVRLRYFGDVGGWTSLAIFTVVAVKGIFERLMAEGEYMRAKKICHDWYSLSIEQNPQKIDSYYSKVCELFDALQARCLFSKTITSRRLLALEVCREPEQLFAAPKLHTDRQLANIYEQVQQEFDEELHTKKCLRNCCLGLASIKKRGCSAVTVSRIFGIVFPVWLVTNCALSIIGEIGLGKEIFVDREELTDIGHFGEWPINAIEAAGTAYLFSSWYAVGAGLVAKTKSIFANYIGTVADDPAVHKRLCQVAKEELAQSSSGVSYLNLPTDNEIEGVEYD